MTVIGCTGLLSPVCSGVTGIGSGVASASAGAVLAAVTGWVVQGASWLLGQIGSVLTSTTSVNLGAGWFVEHYRAMAALAAVVVLPLLLLSVVQAVYRQSASVLVRVVAVQLPLALLLTGAAVQLVQLSVVATDALGGSVSAGVGVDVQTVLQGVAGQLLAQAGGGPDSVPAFVVLLGALLVAVAAFVLWLELLVRAAAVYVAVLFLPMALASLVWPAVSHWCRRLVDTLVALVLAKFVIVAVLSLAAAALASGTQSGFSSVLGGAALLLLASATPFTLLRLVPMVEAGAVHQLEGARHRVRHTFVTAPRSAASYALGRAQSSSLVTGDPGTGTVRDFGTPGDDGGAGAVTAAAGIGAGGRGGEPGGSAPTGSRAPAAAAASAGSRGRRPGRVREPEPGAGAPFAAMGQELPGFPGIPLWRGSPPTLSGGEPTPPISGRHPPTPDDPLGRGPMPVWDGPPPHRAPEAADAGERRTPMTLRFDEFGPVITDWDRGYGSGPGDRSRHDQGELPGQHGAAGEASTGGA